MFIDNVMIIIFLYIEYLSLVYKAYGYTGNNFSSRVGNPVPIANHKFVARVATVS